MFFGQNRRKRAKIAVFRLSAGHAVLGGAEKAAFPRVLLAIETILELHVTHFTSREKKHNKNRRLRALRPP